MTPLRLFAIGAIFFFACIAWMILGSAVHQRTDGALGQLRGEVEGLWGPEHSQSPPTVTVQQWTSVAVDTVVGEGPTAQRATKLERREMSTPALLEASDLDVRLDLEHRQKGLMWWATYGVAFRGHYTFRAPPAPSANGTEPPRLVVRLPMSAVGAVYDDFRFVINGVEHAAAPRDGNAFEVELPYARDTASVLVVDVQYRSRGLGQWTYRLAADGSATTRVTNFALRLDTNVGRVDFPSGTLSPSRKTRSSSGQRLEWTFRSLVSGQAIGVSLPERLSPGPVAARIAFFAPVSLLFFFTVMVIVGVVRGRSLHPVNYFFLAASFFAFHLLFAYLVDVVDVVVAFAIASVTSVGLVVSYLRIVQGTKVALSEAGLAQLLFLVGFSLAFFREGEAGLTIAVGAVLTLFFLMQLTARVKWEDKFAGALVPGEAPRMPEAGATRAPV